MSGEPAETLLFCGGTGVLGWPLAQAFARSGRGVHLLVRRGSRKLLRERVAELRTREPEAADRMRLLTGDLADPALTDDATRARILEDCQGVVQAACERRADKGREQAFAVNVDGTRTLLALARELSGGRFLHLSDLSVLGDHRGLFTEAALLEGQEFPGDPAAESRLLAERHVRNAMGRLPATVLRLASPITERADRERAPDPLRALRPMVGGLLATGLSRGRRLLGATSPRLHALPLPLLVQACLAAWSDPEVVGQTLQIADPFAPTLDRLAARTGRLWSPGLPLPGGGARLETTHADGLLRRAGLTRPSEAELAEAVARLAGNGPGGSPVA